MSGVVQADPVALRARLVGHHGLARPLGDGPRDLPALLARLRMIQLDPLDPFGTNADLVAHARLHGLQRGDVYEGLQPGHAFEHFAKERCLLPAHLFPRYRDRLLQAPWWRHSERMKKVPAAVLDAVEHEIRVRGPLTSYDLTDHGSTEPMDWSGWKGTGKLASLAVTVLWTRCRLVPVGRTGRGKRWDLPERALPHHHDAPGDDDWQRSALLERVEAAGLLPTASGPWWGLLDDVRHTLPQRLEAEGRLQRVGLPGTRKQWWAPVDFFDRPVDEPDGELRVLGPLDPLLWDRELVRRVFDFDYVWEVYKPAAQRRWGWYVSPVLHGDRLVARFEAHREGDAVVVDTLWKEDGAPWDEAAWTRALDRLTAFQARR